MLCIHRHSRYGLECSVTFLPKAFTPDLVKTFVDCMETIEVYDVSEGEVTKLYPVEETKP